jgi:hypothetical protein
MIFRKLTFNVKQNLQYNNNIERLSFEIRNVSLTPFNIDRYSVFQLDFAIGFPNQI